MSPPNYEPVGDYLQHYLRAQLSTMLVELGPQRAVMMPLASVIASLNRAEVAPTHNADTSVSSASQLNGQPSAAQLDEVRVRILLDEIPSLPGGPAGPGGPGGPAGPGSPLELCPSLQPASARAVVIAINTARKPKRVELVRMSRPR